MQFWWNRAVAPIATGEGEYRNLAEAASAIFILLSDGSTGMVGWSYRWALLLLAKVAWS